MVWVASLLEHSVTNAVSIQIDSNDVDDNV